MALLQNPPNMVRIRLSRLGTNKRPFYRIVVAAKEKPRDGNFIGLFATFVPKLTDKSLKFEKERDAYWISKGAQPSKIVEDLVKRS